MAKKSIAVLGHPLSDFPGATVSGSLPLREHLINELLQNKLPSVVKAARIEVLDRNRLAISATVEVFVFTKTLRFELELERGIDFQRSPLLKMRLVQSAGILGLLANVFAKLPDFLTFDGQAITVDLRGILLKAGADDVLPHIKTLEIVTQPKLLTFGFLVRIDE